MMQNMLLRKIQQNFLIIFSNWKLTQIPLKDKKPSLKSPKWQLSKMDELGGQDSLQMLQTLAFYVQAVLEGPQSFLDKRYDKAANIHLQTLFNNNPKLEEGWKEAIVLDLDAVLPYKQEPVSLSINYHEFLNYNILENKHLNIKEYPFLAKALNAGVESVQISLIDALRQEKDKTLKAKLQVQKDLIELLKGKDLANQKGLLNQIKKHLSNIPGSNEFVQDIDDLLKHPSFAPQKSEFPGWTVVDTDDWWDLFVCGTEVTGSCQRVDDDPKNTKGLLSYVLDGQNRLVAIKDPAGKIVARRILRLLFDEKQQKPVLYSEATYPREGDPIWESTLEKIILQKAKKVGLEVYRVGSSSAVEFISQGGIAAL